MSVLRVFEHIGGKIKAANPWINSCAVNAIQLPDGRVVNLIGDEKEEVSFDDSRGYFFYIRVDPKFDYTPLRQVSSAAKDYKVTVRFKFVFFAIDQEADSIDLNPVKLENLFTNNLRFMTFTDYFGVERQIEIVIKKTNVDPALIYLEESKKERQSGASIIAVAIEGELRFNSSNDNCDEDCGISTADNILQTFDFCDPAVIASLCSKQISCLRDAFGGDSTFNQKVDVFNATPGQTLFSLSYAPGGFVFMMVNGVDIESFTVIGNSVVYTGTDYTLESGDFIKFVYST